MGRRRAGLGVVTAFAVNRSLVKPARNLRLTAPSLSVESVTLREVGGLGGILPAGSEGDVAETVFFDPGPSRASDRFVELATPPISSYLLNCHGFREAY
jgi:hypothetical protein